MRSYLFVVALLVVAATATFYGASLLPYDWARDVCTFASGLCERPRWLAIAAAMAGLVLVLLKLTEV